MTCPYCAKGIYGMTGLQELRRFQKHLNTCKKNPANLPVSDGIRTIITPRQHSLTEALNIRHKSGQ